MNKPSISIIVPIYNVAPYVEDCIRSIMRQTYDGKMECILVDDCGTDDSMAIVERLIAEYTGPIEFRIFHHAHNRGLSAARNTGIKQASGEFLMFIDSDDSVHDDFCKDAYNCAKSYHADLVMFSHIRINREGDHELAREFRYSADGIKTQYELLDLMFKDEGTATWNKLYRKNLFDDISFPDGFLYEDEGTIYKLIMRASCIYYLGKPLYFHYFRPGSITTLNNQKGLDDKAYLNLQRYIDLHAWGYHSDILERKIREFGLRYLIRKRRDLSNPDYIRFTHIIQDTKHIPHGYPSKQLFFIYLFKYCPWLFEMYFTMKGVKI